MNNELDRVTANQLIEEIQNNLEMMEPNEELEGVWLPDAGWAEVIRLLRKAANSTPEKEGSK